MRLMQATSRPAPGARTDGPQDVPEERGDLQDVVVDPRDSNGNLPWVE
jgi:hypothetical protein